MSAVVAGRFPEREESLKEKSKKEPEAVGDPEATEARPPCFASGRIHLLVISHRGFGH